MRKAVKRLSIGVDELRDLRRGVVALLYHLVGADTGVQVDLPASLFDEQMSALADSGRAVSLERGLELLDGLPPADGRDPVVVTFDDGTADFVDQALPILQRYDIPATLYVATEFVERGRAFTYGAPAASWAGLRDAVDTGLVTIGSHTHTHALMDRTDDAAGELDRSVGLIEDRLGLTPRHFAYPKAVAGSPSAEAEVRRRFRSAALAGTRPNPYGTTDPHLLARSPIQRSDGMRYFLAKLDGGMSLEGDLRRVFDRVRYWRRTS